jgi:uncharacterized membrane protein YdfJ with MMPL/SSD domain
MGRGPGDRLEAQMQDLAIMTLANGGRSGGRLCPPWPARSTATRAAAIARTGPTVTSAGLILAGTFGVYAVAGGGAMGGQLQAIGLGLALGILLDTFVVRTLLVPSAAVLLGRWNWWPSRLSRAGEPTTPARTSPR